MSEQIIKLAQVNDPILNNLVSTENKLNQLNQEVGMILEEYQKTEILKPSFFNFENPFFLLTLVGLFMLALALWFLKQELKHSKSQKVKSKLIKSSKLEIKVIPKVSKSSEEKKDKAKKVDQEVKIEAKVIKKNIKSKGRKIKVVKVK